MKTIILNEEVEYESESDLKDKLELIRSKNSQDFIDAINGEDDESDDSEEFVKIESEFVGDDITNSKNNIQPSPYPYAINTEETPDVYSPDTKKESEDEESEDVINDEELEIDESESDGE